MKKVSDFEIFDYQFKKDLTSWKNKKDSPKDSVINDFGGCLVENQMVAASNDLELDLNGDSGCASFTNNNAPDGNPDSFANGSKLIIQGL
uniref:Uncharacterized protein n=1 Tax=Panagrolaimus sp. ES5 TaxID=591445 RepID=A0AC34FEG3_9BILA